MNHSLRIPLLVACSLRFMAGHIPYMIWGVPCTRAKV